jgi:glycerol kinase
MEKDLGVKMTELKVDGGVCMNKFVMQFQSDICRAAIVRPFVLETTALGAAFLAGITTGFWKDIDEVKKCRQNGMVFEPIMDTQKRDKLITGWHKSVGRSRSWAEGE